MSSGGKASLVVAFRDDGSLLLLLDFFLRFFFVRFPLPLPLTVAVALAIPLLLPPMYSPSLEDRFRLLDVLPLRPVFFFVDPDS